MKWVKCFQSAVSLCSDEYLIKMKMAVLRQPDLEASLVVFAFDEQQNHKQLVYVEAGTHKRPHTHVSSGVLCDVQGWSESLEG